MEDTDSGFFSPTDVLATLSGLNSDHVRPSEYDLIPSEIARTLEGGKSDEMWFRASQPETTNFGNVIPYTGGTGMNGVKDLIKAALEEPRYDWRTVDGIARETSIPRDVIMRNIHELSMEGVLLRASRPDPNGRVLITTKTHYSKNHNLIDKILSALSDKVR